jgi:hypothetical protein
VTIVTGAGADFHHAAKAAEDARCHRRFGDVGRFVELRHAGNFDFAREGFGEGAVGVRSEDVGLVADRRFLGVCEHLEFGAVNG